MIGILAGVIALVAMSVAVVLGAGILYDPERSYHHHYLKSFCAAGVARRASVAGAPDGVFSVPLCPDAVAAR